MTTYILTNKEQSRVRLSDMGGIHPGYSGELDMISSFKPAVYKSKLKALYKSWLYNAKVTPLHVDHIWSVEDLRGNYVWLSKKGDSRLYKVWVDLTLAPNNASVLKDTGQVMLKDIGCFDKTDFLHVTFINLTGEPTNET